MNDNFRRGPWDAPLPKYIDKREIVVLVHDLKRDETEASIEQEFKLDYGSFEDRKFLGKLSFWAISNGRSVETMALEEWEKMK